MIRFDIRMASTLGAALAAATLVVPAAQAADEKVSQSLQVQVEERSSGNQDISRVQVTAGYNWETGRRESLSLSLPWQSIDTKVNGASNTASGLKDASLRYDFMVREKSQGESTRWSLNLNLPVGKDSLDQREFNAVNNLNSAAEGFLAPQFGRGFAAGIRHYWTRTQGNAKLEWYLGYQEETSYTVASFPGRRLENSGIDQYLAGINRQWQKGRLGIDVGLDVIAFDTGISTNNNQGTRIESDPNYLLKTNIDQKLNERMAMKYSLTYQVRDEQDSLAPGVLVNPNTLELGNRFFWSAVMERSNNSNARWQLGFSGINTERATNKRTGPVSGSSRTEIYSRIGYSRDLPNGGGWNLASDFGLTGDSRDLVVSAAYQRKF